MGVLGARSLKDTFTHTLTTGSISYCARWTPEERANATTDGHWNPKPSVSVVNLDSFGDDFMICSNENMMMIDSPV